MLDIRKIESPRSTKTLELLFLIWLLTLPFVAMIGSVSIGFLTLYPNLIFTGILFVMVIGSFRSWKRMAQLFFAFLFLWAVYAICYPLISDIGFNDDWKIDVRTLLLQWSFAGVLFGTYSRFGHTLFVKLLKSGVIYFLGILLVAGIFEYYTGIHIAGRYTDKLLEQGVVDYNFYAPIFIHDNSNDYLVYLLGISVLFLGLLKEDLANQWKSVALLSLGFIFAKTASSRIAIFVFAALIIIQLVIILVQHIRKQGKLDLVMLSVGAVLFCVLILTNTMFTGTKFSTGDSTTSGEYVSFPTTKPFEGQSSVDVRYHLTLNAIDFIKEQPILGIGPGQFRQRHATYDVNYPTDTVVGPHNFILELITQYGIFGWTYLLLLASIFIQQIRTFLRERKNSWMLFILPVFGLISFLPSSFLYMDLNWFVVPILLLLSSQPLITDTVEDE
ncbi:MAG: O-antigen ligase family protein [Crocinitomicaceae bacterium]|nr:O-antigen ligase family protein [Crocinitomicaceae bacterium]